MNFSGHKPLSPSFFTSILSLLAGVSLLAMPETARAQIFVTNESTNTIGEYNLDGSTINTSLVTGLNYPLGIVVSGSDIFEVNNTNSTDGTVGEYTTSGSTVNASLVSGFQFPNSIAVSGSDIFVVNNGLNTIGKYTTSGSTVNASLVTGLNWPIGIA